jgi:predicted DNA-binding ribbon-helix-helix protein
VLCEVPLGIVLSKPKRLQSPFRRSTWIRRHWSSVSIEYDFRDQLRLIATERQTTLTALLTEINRKGRLLPFQGHGRHRVLTLSAAIRLFGATSIVVARSLIHSSSVIGLSEVMYLPIACSIF